jgi:hypothetical protein
MGEQGKVENKQNWITRRSGEKEERQKDKKGRGGRQELKI